MEPNCADNENNYCNLEWCYVSAECEASDATVANLNEEIKYSYATCGNVVPSEEEEVEEEEEAEPEAEEEVEAEEEEAVPEAEEEEVPFPEELGVCECVDAHDQDVFFPAEGMPFIIYTANGVGYEYPAAYGVGMCSDWDAGLEPYCAENEADFCEPHWCYVSSECEASDATPSNLNPDQAYSYATCGYTGDFPDPGEEEEEEEAEAEEEEEAPEVPFPEEFGVCDCVMSHGQDVHFPADRMAYTTYTADGVDYEYPANYGVGFCSDWDSGLDPYCAENEEDFCEPKWCYVSSDCEASDSTPSNLNPD